MATHAVYSAITADTFRMLKSRSIVTPISGDTYQLLRIPKFTLVKCIYVNVTATFTGSAPTCEVGWSGNGETADPNGFLLTTEVGTAIGMKTSHEIGGAAWAAGKYFNANSGIITATFGGTISAGTITVFADTVRVI